LSARIALLFIHNRLCALEKQLIRCIWSIDSQSQMTPFLSAEFHLGLKAVASAIATIHLIRKDLRQEAEGPQRSFLESWIFMMHFAWFPGDVLFSEWSGNPKRHFGERQFRFKERVETELPKRLGLTEKQHVPLRRIFSVLSNTAVHPTKDSAERSWGEAASRRGFKPPDDVTKEWEDARLTNFILALALFFTQLHLFLKFFREHILGRPEIPAELKLNRKSFLEIALGDWERFFTQRFKAVLEKFKEDIGNEAC